MSERMPPPDEQASELTRLSEIVFEFQAQFQRSQQRLHETAQLLNDHYQLQDRVVDLERHVADLEHRLEAHELPDEINGSRIAALRERPTFRDWSTRPSPPVDLPWEHNRDVAETAMPTTDRSVQVDADEPEEELLDLNDLNARAELALRERVEDRLELAVDAALERLDAPPEDCDNCPICIEPWQFPVRLGCGHVFDHECIRKWLVERRWNCPLCRQDVPLEAQVDGLDAVEQRVDGMLVQLVRSHVRARQLINDLEGSDMEDESDEVTADEQTVPDVPRPTGVSTAALAELGRRMEPGILGLHGRRVPSDAVVEPDESEPETGDFPPYTNFTGEQSSNDEVEPDQREYDTGDFPPHMDFMEAHHSDDVVEPGEQDVYYEEDPSFGPEMYSPGPTYIAVASDTDPGADADIDSDSDDEMWSDPREQHHAHAAFHDDDNFDVDYDSGTGYYDDDGHSDLGAAYDSDACMAQGSWSDSAAEAEDPDAMRAFANEDSYDSRTVFDITSEREATPYEADADEDMGDGTAYVPNYEDLEDEEVSDVPVDYDSQAEAGLEEW